MHSMVELTELNKALRDAATGRGMCEAVAAKWRGDLSRRELVELFTSPQGFEFYEVSHFLDLGLAKAAFTREELHGGGVYVDEDVTGAKGHVYLLGACHGELRAAGYDVLTVHATGKSEVKIVADGLSKVIVDLCDEARAEIKASDGALCFARVADMARATGDCFVRNRKIVRDESK